jgi:hypothetical protein
MNQDGGRRLPGLLPSFSLGKSAGAGKEALGVRVGLTGFKPPHQAISQGTVSYG